MISNKKNFLLLSLIIFSFLFQSIIATEVDEEEDNKIYEEPKLIGLSKGILEKKKQPITLIFQNSRISPKGFQEFYLRKDKNSTLYKVHISCKEKKPLTNDIIGVFCEIDLKSSDIRLGDYVIESIRYKNMFFLDEQTHFRILENKDYFDFIDIDRIIRVSQYNIYLNLSHTRMNVDSIKSMKIASKKKEYELELKRCHVYAYSGKETVSCEVDMNIPIDEYNVKYLVYNNEKIKPKSDLIFYVIINNPGLSRFPCKVERKKKLETVLYFGDEFDEPIDFYFREINHPYILYKIQNQPVGPWTKEKRYDRYNEWYEAYKTFYLDTENIPVGHYKLEYVFQNAKYYFTERNIDVI